MAHKGAQMCYARDDRDSGLQLVSFTHGQQPNAGTENWECVRPKHLKPYARYHIRNQRIVAFVAPYPCDPLLMGLR